MLGLHYFELKEYQTALGYLRQSVAVNSMQVDAWYRIGFISLQQEQWEAAATAYRQVLQFEAEEGSGFEAWNNLSKAYIKLGEKARAMRTLQEAIRLNFEEWKLWDNYIAVAADVGAFGEVLEAWGRLIDLKGGYVDETISGILVRAVVDGDIRDSEGEPAATPRYRAKVMKLFARVAATSDGSAGFWRHYAQLLMAEAKREREDGEEGVNVGGMKIDPSRITQCLGKCHRKALARDPAWAKDLGKTAELAGHCVRLAEEYLEVADIFGNDSAASVLGSGKLTLNSALVLLKRARDDLVLFSGEAEGGKIGDLEEMLAKLEGALQTIKGAIEEKQGGAQV
ncbi:PREDICTED: tetratricopeptide repeat protein 27-like [Rhagoletis zephyria]|uniref:tetratricopeptide repeat protein 27-like n=1 Tax=Rhagoletis zephyria TaxID=28612 RepID=UPI00081143DD|nr:PREDICTED: tetratricopeptide repeat protein 27-like [Rhagoletis zephyria]